VVMNGQGILPAGYHPYVDKLPEPDLKDFMAETRASISQIVARQPQHHDYLAALSAARPGMDWHPSSSLSARARSNTP